MDTSPAVTAEYVYVADRDGMVRILDRESGQMLGGAELADATFTAPIVANDMLYVGNRSGRFHVIYADIDGGGGFGLDRGSKHSSAAVCGRMLYVVSDDGYLYAFEPAADDGPERDLVFADDFEDGQFDWTDAGHPEFWTETDGQVRYTPSTSAGDRGDNYAYADATYDGGRGLLRWPVAIEFEAYASDTSADVGVLATDGGPKDDGESGNPRLAIHDSKHDDEFTVRNTRGETYTLSPSRENDTWYTYRLVPDLENNVVRISRNDRSWTVPELTTERIGNTSIALSGATCWGCGGTGDRRWESVTVWELPVPGE